MSSGSIFICYRREDSIAYAGRLYDRLSSHFGAHRVFMDVDAIQPGEDFVEVLERRVGACDAMIAVIGRDWLDSRDPDGRRRLDDPDDYVRREITAALERKVRVIPALVGGARMPRSTDMPPEIGGLARRNAIELTDSAFHVSVGRLIDTLDAVIANPSGAGAAPPPVAAPQPPKAAQPRRAWFASWTQWHTAVGSSFAAAALVAAAVVYLRPPAPVANSAPPPAASSAPHPAPAAVEQKLPPRDTPPKDTASTTPAPAKTEPEPKVEPPPASPAPQRPAAVNASRTVAAPAARKPAPAPVRVGGAIRQPTKTKHVAPVYPPVAQASRVQGIVILEATVNTRGLVSDVKVLRSIPLLDQAAIDAVRQWEFMPTLLNGAAVPVIMTVTVQFTLTDDRADLLKYVDRLQTAGNSAAARDMLRKVFAVNAWGSSDAAVFSTLRTNVQNATAAQLKQAASLLPKE